MSSARITLPGSSGIFFPSVEFDFSPAPDPDNVLAPGSRMPFLHVTGRQFQIEKSAGFHKRGSPNPTGEGTNRASVPSA
jgi:hypothetical protein